MELDPVRVKALNQQIRQLADRLPGARDESHKYGFACECGCGKIVALSAAEFDGNGGAWADGHEVAERRAL